MLPQNRTMALITFTSDLGTKDYYVASVKAKILQYNPNIQVIDISHHIEPFNIGHGAFVLNAVFRDFPKGTVHLVSVHSLSAKSDKYIAVKMEEHFFVGTDNGLFSLLSDRPYMSVELNMDDRGASLTFPEKNVFAFAAVSLASGKSIYDLGPQMPPNSLSKLNNRKVKATKNQIEGHVIYVDSLGNLVSNIHRKHMEEVGHGRAFSIVAGRETIDKIRSFYYEVSPGDCCMLYNDLGFLELGINNGNASELLGLKYDSPLRVVFYPEL